MRVKHGFAVFIFMSIVFSSCNKDVSPYSLSGHIYFGCPPQTFADIEMLLYQESTGGGFFPYKPGKLLATCNTDSQGYFKLTANSGGSVSLQCESSDFMLPVHPENINNIEIYENVETSLKVSFDVTTPYTTSDTLYLYASDSTGSQMKLAGPFTSGFKFIIPHYFVGTIVKNVDSYDRIITLNYYINSSDIFTEEIDLNICDTSFVVLYL